MDTAGIKLLCELAEVRTGYPFRGGVDRVREGGCLLVQAGNIDSEAGGLVGEPARIERPGNMEDHALRGGDVLMVGRGPRNDAAAFTWERTDVLAASYLIVVRAKGSVHAGFLNWFLNLPATQARIRAMRSESTVPFVAVEALRRLRVPVPSAEVQEKVAKLHELNMREQELLRKIGERRRVLMDALLKQAVGVEQEQTERTEKAN
ncbi:MAG: hypothetical protein C5B50_27380 [Verrucomicrobia bacterium]|nr:MAG: hypothetical protein C5B50_27380 [Verrucomicrobiota bacterium]